MRASPRDVPAMPQPEFSAAFTGSPLKRAKRRGLKRNAAVVLAGDRSTMIDEPRPPFPSERPS